MDYVAFQYAEALFSLAQEEQQTITVQTAFNQFLHEMDESFTQLLNHPKVTKAQKKEVLGHIVDNTIFLHFLFVLLDNSRINKIKDCYDEFQLILNNQHKIMDVQVYSKKALSSKEVDAICTNIGKKHNRTVTIKNIVDPHILGGLRIEYDGNVLDQTINHYLQSLKSSLTK